MDFIFELLSEPFTDSQVFKDLINNLTAKSALKVVTGETPFL